MAGANGFEKRLPCDREERIHLKELSPAYYSRFVNPGPIPNNDLVDPVTNTVNTTALRYPFLAPIIPVSGVLDVQQVTNDIYLDGTVANAMSTPSAATIAAYVGQKYLTSLGIGELGQTAQTALQNELDGFETTVENFDPTNTKTITFGAGITPASIAFLPKTISVVRWEFTRNNPPTLRVYVLSVTSSTSGLPIPNPPVPIVFPVGILANDGTTIFGRTIVSTDPELVVTNGDGTLGNPSLNINVTGVGLVPGGVVQNQVNYLGQIFNTANGFSAYGSSGSVAVPAGAAGSFALLATDDGTTIGHKYGYTTDPNYTSATPSYTVTAIVPAQDPERYSIEATAEFVYTDATDTGIVQLNAWDVGNARNIDGAFAAASAAAIPGYSQGTVSFSGEYDLPVGTVVSLTMQNTNAHQVDVTYFHWNMRRIQ